MASYLSSQFVFPSISLRLLEANYATTELQITAATVRLRSQPITTTSTLLSPPVFSVSFCRAEIPSFPSTAAYNKQDATQKKVNTFSYKSLNPSWACKQALQVNSVSLFFFPPLLLLPFLTHWFGSVLVSASGGM